MSSSSKELDDLRFPSEETTLATLRSSSKEFGDLQVPSEETASDTMSSSSKELDDLEIPLEKIALATNNFAGENLIYKGVLNVYKGKFLGSGQLGNIVVRRRLGHAYEQWEDELWKDLLDFPTGLLTELTVVGYCDKKIIIYEHVGNGSICKDVSDPTFDWMQRLDICHHLASSFLSKSGGSALDRRPYCEIVYMICLGDLMFEVLCEKKGEEHVTPMAIKYYKKGELDKIIHPHLSLQMHQQSFTIFSSTAYDCIVKQPCVDIIYIRQELSQALILQTEHERHKKINDLEIPFEEIALATNNFGDQNLIYTDEYINVYKGKVVLGSGQLGNIVVQRRLDDWKELLETFHLDAFVVGFCADKKIVVYHHLGNGRLKNDVTFDWMQRLLTCIKLAYVWRPMYPKSYSEYVFNLCLGDLMFQVLCQKKAEEHPSILTMAIEHYDKGELWEIIDPNVRVQMHHLSLTIFSRTAYNCIKQPWIGNQEILIQLEEALLHQSKHEAYLECIKIELEAIKLSTNNFADEHIIGSGTYGTVYKAELNHFDRESCSIKRSTVAIKSISEREDGQGDKGFFKELNMLSCCEHYNIISLLGFCHEGSKRILVYEYAVKQSLSEYLGSRNDKIILSWAKRLQISLDIARGLNYLHNNKKDKPRIVHRDIKSDNILLDANWNAKIGDFGLSKFHPMNQRASTINTKNIAGTPFYVDPEYLKKGHLKKESDIYSLGVVLFELLSGRLAYDSIYLDENENGLPAIVRQRKGTLKDMVDPKMKEVDEFISTLYYGPNQDSLDTFLEIAHRCLAETQIERPTIEEIIKELQKALNFEENRKDILMKFSLGDIHLGTENFSGNNCIKRGAHGKAYKGKVQIHNKPKDIVAMRFHRYSHEDDPSLKKKKEDEILAEMEILVKHKHENIVDLVGYCKEGNENIFVYGHASIGSLDMHLNNAIIGWVERLKISIDVASSLEFLHEKVQVIHRDFKSASILLNGDWRARLVDFGLYLAAPLNKEIEDYDINDVFSTPGYCDPSYWRTGSLTKESDIYSLGVVLFEILCGKSTLENYNNEGQFLDDSVKKHFEESRVYEIVFNDIKQQIVPHSLTTFQMIANRCLHERTQKRPTATEVVVQLKKALEFQEIKMGCFPNASEVIETTHLKRGSTSWEALKDLEAQMKAERARTADLEEKIMVERARNAELEETIVVERARNVELEERIMVDQARIAKLEEKITVEGLKLQGWKRQYWLNGLKLQSW